MRTRSLSLVFIPLIVLLILVAVHTSATASSPTVGRNFRSVISDSDTVVVTLTEDLPVLSADLYFEVVIDGSIYGVGLVEGQRVYNVDMHQFPDSTEPIEIWLGIYGKVALNGVELPTFDGELITGIQSVGMTVAGPDSWGRMRLTPGVSWNNPVLGEKWSTIEYIPTNWVGLTQAEMDHITTALDALTDVEYALSFDAADVYLGCASGSFSIVPRVSLGPDHFVQGAPYVYTCPGLPEMRFKRTDTGAEVADGSSVAFPQTTIGAPVLLELAICNDGPGSLTFPNATTGKVSGSGFTQMSYVPPGLAPGLCIPFGVRFTGSSLGTFNGSITVDNSDADENPYNIALSATVVASPPPAPEIRVKRADTGVEIADGGSFTFPQTPVGNLPISQAFSICNDGTGSLTLDTTLAMVSGSQFTQVGSAPAATVAPGACTNLSVQFSASNPGLYNGAISIGNNDANENPYTIALGATAAQNSPQIHVQSQTVTRQGSSQIRGVDQVLVTDQNNQPMAGVLVRATYSGPSQGQVSGTTGSNGRVTLQTSQVRRPQGKWCFQITSLSKNGYTYNSAANVVTVQCE